MRYLYDFLSWHIIKEKMGGPFFHLLHISMLNISGNMTSKELDFLHSQDFMSNGAGFVYNSRHTPQHSQDPAGPDMHLYNDISSLCEEDFGSFTTTLDGIMYSFNVLADEIRNYTSILLSKLDERAKPNTSAIPQVKGACFICHRLEHTAPRVSRPAVQTLTFIKPVFQMRLGRTLGERLA